MKGTYKAVQVSAPGTLQVVERPVTEPAAGQVRIRVEACGICHTDAYTINGTYPGLTLPRVPGHEVIGRIEALGQGVSRWKIGQRVGVGLIAGEDGVCEPCRRGDMVNCEHPVVSGVTADGGYAEVMIAEARGIASVPDELTSAEAAPLLCAGVTTFNALRNAGLRGGDLIAVQGVGGLGHLGVQFARHIVVTLNNIGWVDGTSNVAADTTTPDPLGEDWCGFGTHLICRSFVWRNGRRMLVPTLGGNNGDVSTITN